MFSLANKIYFSTKKGKRKKIKGINIQSTLKLRHLIKAGGSTTVSNGHPLVVPRKRGTEPVSHCLPTAKKVRKAHPHSLSESLVAN